ncbi:MAG: archease [Candidatus Theseobacter exili]|nr:archease [Candidatus Theseobacter exili]
MTKTGYEYLDHEADMGIVGRGKTLEEAFESVGMGMIDLVKGDSAFNANKQYEIVCEAEDIPGLLIAFLNEIIAQMDLNSCLFIKCDNVIIDSVNHRLSSVLSGGDIADCLDKENLGNEVKAATYCGLRVSQLKDGFYEAQCVVDL